MIIGRYGVLFFIHDTHRSFSMSCILFLQIIQRKSSQQLNNSPNLVWHIQQMQTQLIIHHLLQLDMQICGLRYIRTILSWKKSLGAVYYITNYFTFISDKTEEIQVKIWDFQEYRYESFANDLISFLLLCARFDDLKTNFISFIEFYYLEFTNPLKSVHLPLED